jgi:hypothetical protein
MDLNSTIYNIHVFGDSHSRIYSSPYLSNYICNVYYVGPITMHRVGRDNLSINELKDLSKKYYEEYLIDCKPEYKHMSYPNDDTIKDNDVVIFVFGEIDIRNHYGKQVKEGRNPDEIVTTLTTNYMETILFNKNQYKNVQFGIQSINPPVDENNLKESLKEYPMNGTIEERIDVTLKINEVLKRLCQENDILFIDTANYYQNDDTIFPLYGLCKNAKLYELDTRIKDSNVHINIQYPEGIEHCFKMVELPINIKYYEYAKKCKYSSTLNKFQRDYIVHIRKVHYFFILLLVLSLFIPNKYFMITMTFWVTAIFLNIAISNGVNCFFSVLEFRLSNCNDRSLFEEIGFKQIGIPRSYIYLIWVCLYLIAIIVITFRSYYYFNKKNLFNIKFNFKYMK